MALIYVTETRARADLAVNVTDNRVNADLKVLFITGFALIPRIADNDP